MGTDLEGSLHRSRHRRSGSLRGAASAVGLIAAFCTASACEFAPSGLAGNGPGGEADSGTPEPDAMPLPEVDAAPPDALPPDEFAHLLLTEVKANGGDSQFIEIHNPLSSPIELREYYLTDDPSYALLPQNDRDGTAPVVGNFDVLARFPFFSLPAGAVVVVALDEDGFRDEFDREADFAIVPSTSDPEAEAMEIVAEGSMPGIVDLTDNGEAIILFRWDGASDLVTDVDIVFVGESEIAAGAENGVPDKTGQSVDGPDGDAREQAYLPDAHSMLRMLRRNGGSYKRIAHEGANEPASGGNGVNGHDETSEDTRTTWEQEVNTPATPGIVNLD